MAHKNKPKRSKIEIKRDRARIAALYLRGYTQEQIAEEFGISRDMVQHDVMRIREEWSASTLYDFNEAKTKALAEIANLKATAWKAWDKSANGRKKTKQVKNEKGGPPNRAELTVEDSAGDPRFLITIKELIAEEMKILGIYPSRQSGEVIDVSSTLEDPTKTKIIALTAFGELKEAPKE